MAGPRELKFLDYLLILDYLLKIKKIAGNRKYDSHPQFSEIRKILKDFNPMPHGSIRFDHIKDLFFEGLSSFP